jgi:glycosyltransferase involved in cell wall biosynthesis
LFALVESLSYVYRLSQLVRKMRPTILYCNLPKSGVILAVVSRLTFRPLVFHTHGVENSSHIGRLYRIILAVAKKVICVSEHTRQQMVNAKVNPTKISVVYNGLDSSWFKDEALGATRAEFGLDSSAFVFGFVGNLIKRKGVDVLVKGFSETFTRLPARERIFVHLALVGDDPDGSRGQFISMARENVAKRGVIDNVHFLGRRTDIKRFMNSIDVLVLPARMESFGVVLIEAMSQGVPVIATAVAAIPEVVQDGVTGLLVPPERPLALADAMTSLYASPDLRRQLGERGRQDVRKRFSQEVLTRQLLEVINTHSRNDV